MWLFFRCVLDVAVTMEPGYAAVHLIIPGLKHFVLETLEPAIGMLTGYERQNRRRRTRKRRQRQSRAAAAAATARRFAS